MKKTLPFFMLFLWVGIVCQAQVLVPTTPMLKNVVLEEYTGIHCQYCPDGHAISQALADNNPGRVVLINIHQGSFSVPGAGEPDFRTAFGDALAGQTSLTGYPSGTVNRHVFPGNTATALGRSAWGAAATTVFDEISPVNVGINSDYDAGTRTLTVTVELYYTSSSPAANNFINVALLQDSIYGPQTGGNAGNNYHHKHMLRHLLTGQWGDTVNTTTQGSLVTRVYTYVVPADYNNVPCLVEDCHVAAFVTESHQEVYTGDVVYAIGGTNKFVGDFTPPADLVKSGTSANPATFSFTANSALTTAESFQFDLTNSGMPVDWTSGFTVNGTAYTTTATVTLDPAVPMPMAIVVTPGTSPAVSKFNLTMKSLTNPMAPTRQMDVYVIANVTDLVVNGSGGNETWTYDSIYMNGLTLAGDLHHATASATLLHNGIVSGAFNDVNNIYLNIGWTFPALKDAEAVALQSFMDQGGNVLVSGQDIGWDIMSAASGSNGDSITRNLYTNYFMANFVDDGTSSNNQLTANVSDPIFGSIPLSTVIDPYGGNMYPEQITPRTGASSIFYYNNNTAKTAAIRGETNNFKVVYLGVSLEMIGNKSVKNAIVKKAYDWFYGTVSTPEFDKEMALMMGQNYPNPANGYTSIPVFSPKQDLKLELCDITGRILCQVPVSAGSTHVDLNTAELQSGMYFYRLLNGNQSLQVKSIQVIH